MTLSFYLPTYLSTYLYIDILHTICKMCEQVCTLSIHVLH